MTTLPLVSVVTPTFNRREFFQRAVKCFLAYDYAPLEWVIVNNGTDPIADLLPDDPRIRYTMLGGQRLSHGAMMNECCERALGEIFIIHDDDDFYVPDRVTRQVMPLINDPALTVTGTSVLLYYKVGTQLAYRYRNLSSKNWIGAFAARKSVWDAHRFIDKIHGADFEFINSIPREQWCDLNDLTLMISAIHPNNAAPKRLPSPSFVEEPWETVRAIAGGEL